MIRYRLKQFNFSLSKEELSSLRETLTSERNELIKERERQSRAAASVGSDEYNDVQVSMFIRSLLLVKSSFCKSSLSTRLSENHRFVGQFADVYMFSM